MDKYYLGLDMGTSSVGWAVTDENYRIVRMKGKDFWGVREFEEAQPAAARRSFRTSRRRRQREQVRVGLLKDYFAEAIAEVDPNFYARLENSKYHLEDKDENVRTPNTLFADKEYSDKEYFEEYPTIFHLRQELISNPEPHDVRLVFLALLNIYKHRGHFLNAGAASEDTLKIDEAYIRLTNLLNENLEISFPSADCEMISSILSDRNCSRSEKSDRLVALLNIDKKCKKELMIVKMICGLKGDAKTLFGLEELEEKVEIQFSSFGYDEKEAEIEEAIGSELFEIISAMKMLYDIGSLAGILRGSDYLSEARIKDYDKHKNDLELLKNVIRKYCSQEIYNKIFRSEENGSYSAYVNSVSYRKLYKDGEQSKHRRNMKGRKRDDFYVSVKNILKTIPDCEEKKQILQDIDRETFMPKQLTASNGVIPYQVHEKELNAILKNASTYLPFLNEVDETGISIAEQIRELFVFRIPYYVGPITEKSKADGGTGWVVRKENGPIRPWNIQDKIDLKKTSEAFISRMVRRCTYINGEMVMPKCSLMYESYCVLNEINNIRIDNERISVELKQEIYNDLFKTGKRITRKQLEKYLFGRGLITNSSQVSAIDKSINNALTSYGVFNSILGSEIDTDYGKKKVEDIIFWCTLYSDSKEFLIENIKDHYPEMTSKQIKRITGIKFKDWGKLSKEFLELQGCEKGSGEVMSLYRALWETPYNLMEILHSDEYTFKEVLKEKQTTALKSLAEFEPEDFDEYYFSAPVRKMIWQTLSIIKEVQKLMKKSPDKIFIEMTRSDEEKGDRGRKDSRKKQLLELYKSVKDDTRNWKELIEDADKTGKLRSKKMYLYLTQMGRDMYTGEPIDLDQLFNNNIYDIDHIYPRHFVKDDSIHNNLVLVHKTKNAHKSDRYPLESSIRKDTSVQELWYTLKDKKLITEEKYRRLTGNKEFTEEQKAEFIARQLVETSQATKGVADLLKELIPDSEVVYAKARNVSDFRRKYDLLKSRLVNDFHHAHDAYLNIVVGNVYLTKFTKNPRNFIRNEYMKDQKRNGYHLSNMFDKDVIRGNQTAWIAPVKNGSQGSIIVIKKTLSRNTPMITKEIREATGQLFNETIYGKSRAKASNYVAIKTSDPRLSQLEKYGGYTSMKPSYLMLVEHGKNGKRKRTFECVPVILKDKLISDSDFIEYCKSSLGLINPRICIRKIKLNTLLKIDGYYVRVVGIDSRKNIELHNAVSLCLEQQWMNYIKRVEKAAEENMENQYISIEQNEKLYDLLTYKHCETIFKNKPKSSGTMLKNGKEKFQNMDIVSQCKVLINILVLSRVGAANVDLKCIGGSGEEGRMRISGNITGKKEVLLYHQSITGIYEKVTLNLLEV